jgi:Glycosyl hydrolases family 43
VVVLMVAGVVSIVVPILALQGTKPVTRPVTTEPPPVDAMSTAHVFASTKGLISDPFVLPGSKLDHMYSSGRSGVGQPHLPERTFSVMGDYVSLRDAVPLLPSWVKPDSGLWAPDVRKIGRTYVMWFSGVDRSDSLPNRAPLRCIGIATSTSSTGPFVSRSDGPAICQKSQYGDIDPRTFVASDGQEWLYWKNDGNAGGLKTHIYARRLARDGQTLIGRTSVLLTNDLPWEGDLIEAPDMVQVGHRYLLFFAGNNSANAGSGIGLALCRGPSGPCTSPYSGPWLGSNTQGAGPGEETVYRQNGITWMLYTPHAIYYTYAFPTLAAARIAFEPTGLPYIADRQGMTPGVTAGKAGQVGTTSDRVPHAVETRSPLSSAGRR